MLGPGLFRAAHNIVTKRLGPGRGTASGWRRLLAFGVDYVLISAYIVALLGISLGAQRALGVEVGMPTTWRQRLAGQLVAFATLTVPVALYFALFDASRLQATPGKRLLGLQVVTETGGRVSTIRAILRAMVKLAPWELAHAALWTTPGWPAQAAPTSLNMAGFGLALALAGGYVLTLFVGSRRTPYDHAAGTRVVSSSSR